MVPSQESACFARDRGESLTLGLQVVDINEMRWQITQLRVMLERRAIAISCLQGILPQFTHGTEMHPSCFPAQMPPLVSF